MKNDWKCHIERKVALFILVLLSSFSQVMAVGIIPLWFTEPQKNEFVGISPFIKDAGKPMEKVAVMSALLNYVISTQNDFKIGSGLSEGVIHVETSVDYYISRRDVVDKELFLSLTVLKNNKSKCKYVIDLNSNEISMDRDNTVYFKRKDFFTIQLQEGNTIDTCIVYIENNSFRIGESPDTCETKMFISYKDFISSISNYFVMGETNEDKQYPQFCHLLEMGKWNYKRSFINGSKAMNYMETMLKMFIEKAGDCLSPGNSTFKDTRNVANYFLGNTIYSLFGKKDSR